jgi:hypothetical protein
VPSMKAGWRSGTTTAAQAWPGTAALPAASDSFDPSSKACTAGYAASGSARRFAVTGLSQQPPAPVSQLRWSRWRRRHQATARACHYGRRAQTRS